VEGGAWCTTSGPDLAFANGVQVETQFQPCSPDECGIFVKKYFNTLF
jgi:hypothetical protein